MKSSLKRVITALLATVMLAAIPCVPAFGAQEYYVNDGENTLALADAYAIGADGSTAKLPERGVYAATASGTQLLGGSEYDDEQPNIPNGIVRVGLAFGSTALDAVHLQIKTGSGFAFGYYDSDRVFQSVGSTAESAVTVIADTNVTVGDSAFGAYHVQLGDTYASFDAAQAAANSCGGYPVYYNGSYRVRIGSYRSADDAPAGQGTVVSGGARSVLVVKAGTEQILFGFDCGSTRSLSLAPQNGSGAAITQVAECKERNGSRSCTYYGDFQFTRLSTQEPQKLTLVNFVGLEPYVKGVTPYEMSSGWPLEALKAQTVCARTYAASQTRHRSAGFDVCSTTDCQAYRGAALSNERSDAAAEETRGVYLYYNGELVTNAVYYSCNGGASESCKNVWGSEVPYLQGKLDPYEASVAWRFSRYYWSFTATGDELREVLKSEANTDIGQVQNVYVSEYSDMGNVIAITYEGTRGSYTARREKCRTLLNGVYDHINVRSMRYTVTGGDASTYYVNDAQSSVTGTGGLYVIDGDGAVTPNNAGAKDTYVITSGGVQSLERKSANTSNTFTFSGSGWGHNVGMSQWGAFAMAEQGYTYRDILNFYYTGITLS